MKTIMRRTMKAILMNNDIPNEVNLGSYTWNKIIKDGYVSIKDDCSENKKAKGSFRKINLPDYFHVLDNKLTIDDNAHSCLTVDFGYIKYDSFDKNCILFGNFCQIYKIHKKMSEHGTEHFYNGNIINYFDL